jgi:hypothetical protein
MIGSSAQNFSLLIGRTYLPSKDSFLFMCATCGCGIDLGSIEEVFAKDYRCGDCSLVFKGSVYSHY